MSRVGLSAQFHPRVHRVQVQRLPRVSRCCYGAPTVWLCRRVLVVASCGCDGASLAAAGADATRMAAEVAAHADAAAAAAEEAAAAALDAAQMAMEATEIAAEARAAAVAAGEIDVASGLCDDAAADAEASDEMRMVDLGGVAGEMSGEQVASPSALFSAARRRMRAIWPRTRGGQSPSTLSSSRPNSNEALGVVPVERQRSRELSSRGSSRTSWMASALAVSLNAISPSRRSQRHRPRNALSSSADGSADKPLRCTRQARAMRA